MTDEQKQEEPTPAAEEAVPAEEAASDESDAGAEGGNDEQGDTE